MKTADKSLSRREFARKAALGTAALVACPDLDRTTVNPDNAPPLYPGHAPHERQSESPQAAARTPKLSPQSQAEADSRYQSIVAQYPDGFSDLQKAELKRLCVFLQPSLDHIRAYTLANGDLPGLYLKPLVDRDKKPLASSPAATAAAPPKPSPAGSTGSPGKPPSTGKP
jgi:hypothetical protein